MNESLLALFISCTPACSNVIGEVALVRGDVRRRLPGDILWMPIRKDTFIIDGDTLYTGSDGSRVKVRLAKDTTLDINSDSMVNVRLENNLPVLNLDAGSLKSYGGPGDLLKVRVNKKIITVNLSGKPQEINRDVIKNYGSIKDFKSKQKASQNGYSDFQLDSTVPEGSRIKTRLAAPSSEQQPIEWKNKEYNAGANDQTKKIFIIIIISLYGLVSLAVLREVYKNRSKNK